MSSTWSSIVDLLVLFFLLVLILRYLIKAILLWQNHGTAHLYKKTCQFLLHRLLCIPIKDNTPNQPIQHESYIEKIVQDNIRALHQQNAEKTIKEIFNEKFPYLAPLNFFKVTSKNFRLNLVMNQFNGTCPLGEVASPIILATLFSNKFKIPLRIITRQTENNPNDFFSLLDLMQIPRPKKVEFYSDFCFQQPITPHKLDISDNDIFLATSWSTSQIVKSVNFRDTFFYMLQDIEALFYPKAAQKSWIGAILNEASIRYIMDSKILKNYFNNKSAYTQLVNQSMDFERVFPNHLFPLKKNPFFSKNKKKLLFYSQEHYSYEFYAGLQMLDEALLKGMIEDNWEIYFPHQTSNSVIFSNGTRPKKLEKLNWTHYLEFINTVDLCFSLDNTCHPNFISDDILAAGGVVLTNQYAAKYDSFYSKNMIFTSLEKKAVMEGIKDAIALSKDLEKRSINCIHHMNESNWENSLEPVLNFMYEHK